MTNFNHQFEKIGDILIHDGCIDESQLSDALEEQKIKKGKIGHILLKKGYITEANLATAFSLQLGFDMISGEDLLNSDEDVVSLLSEEFSKENLVIAVKKTDSTITLAMEDPENLEVIDSVKKMTNLKWIFFFPLGINHTIIGYGIQSPLANRVEKTILFNIVKSNICRNGSLVSIYTEFQCCSDFVWGISVINANLEWITLT